MNRPLYMGSTALGSVISTAPMAAMGAKRMTLKPRYAMNMRKQSAAMQMMKLMNSSQYNEARNQSESVHT